MMNKVLERKITRDLKKRFVPDQEAQNAIWIHSCRTVQDMENILNGSVGELCCSSLNDPLAFNACGLLLKGTVTLMFTCDCYSYYNRDTQERVLSDYRQFRSKIVNRYCDLKVDPEDSLGYTESWVKPHEIVGLFIWKSMADELPEWVTHQVAEFAIQNNLPIIIIDK